MKTGLVLEGGAMRGMYTCGVTDLLTENGVTFDGAVGVSAGAVFGCNLKSGQPGRALRYNLRYCRDPRYASLRSLLFTGDLYGADFAYRQLPEQLDPFDTEAFRRSPMEFWVTCTDADTGRPVYRLCRDGGRGDVRWMRASASMPLCSRLVRIGHRLLTDGGVADSIPLRFLEGKGYDRIVVILTQPEGYVKQKNRLLPVIRGALHRYPKLVEALAWRHLRYNETLEYIRLRERQGDVLVFRPPVPLEIGPVEHDPEELRRVYRIGREDAARRLEAVCGFLARD